LRKKIVTSGDAPRYVYIYITDPILGGNLTIELRRQGRRQELDVEDDFL
jgi:hypothetical protein